MTVFFVTPVSADVISDRKNGFRDNSIAIRAITKSIRNKDFQNIIENAKKIEQWSIVMSEYFPIGSNQGNTNASENIWQDFDSFKLKILDNTNTAQALILAAESKNLSNVKQLTSELGSTCQSCHMKFKR
jgi:cytochrome c556